ncbi:hypothetical protein [Prochlorothrix hollandica]|nr:hypothetical protein [Prochlorothrix hollandica]
MVAPVVGRQEGRHGGENPTQGQLFQKVKCTPLIRLSPAIVGLKPYSLSP